MDDQVKVESPDGKQRFEFASNIALRMYTPLEGVTAPSRVQVVMWNERLPIQLVFETLDQDWLQHFAVSIGEAAKLLGENPENVQYFGDSAYQDGEEIEVKAASETVDPPTGESSNEGEK